ncbi:bola-like protein [Daldinia caldariorum]|uniref:bola-like protein n=1 Tax=Daldinia caldariorum TaxID=326644 RepID=UPI0020078084|nr:bola-like protein [Daldinia caldariorum]KAI1469472.1 bola-like protein [Daldinia caldariorum]
MLCNRCCRLVTISPKRSSAILSHHARPIHISPVQAQTQIRALVQPAIRNSFKARGAIARHYSTPSGSTAASSADVPPAQPSGPEKPDYLDDAESAIWDKLTAEFEPTELMVQDISGGCGSMYGIEIASEKFRGVNMLKQQRMVNAVLGDQMKGWHGVQLRTKVP